ncbi:hypothetical protein E2C01_052396 [Portunus trituberculatus]|uniref:Uncharacterized protein n=1 Tax=Portunus trituberculatus TaxID=210409 RepID=A0A5B7GHF4_PORTR|nr:hypothetical protein [Portunus trituberculatus]
MRLEFHTLSQLMQRCLGLTEYTMKARRSCQTLSERPDMPRAVLPCQKDAVNERPFEEEDSDRLLFSP